MKSLEGSWLSWRSQVFDTTSAKDFPAAVVTIFGGGPKNVRLRYLRRVLRNRF